MVFVSAELGQNLECFSMLKKSYKMLYCVIEMKSNATYDMHEWPSWYHFLKFWSVYSRKIGTTSFLIILLRIIWLRTLRQIQSYFFLSGIYFLGNPLRMTIHVFELYGVLIDLYPDKLHSTKSWKTDNSYWNNWLKCYDIVLGPIATRISAT